MLFGIDWKARLNNYGFLVSFFSLLLIVLQDIAAKYGIAFDSQLYNDIVTLFLAVVTGLGIVNNPETISKWFVDDEPEKKDY
jgi:phi LC3 family holin